MWRTKDPALESRLKASYDSLAATDNRRLPVTVAVHGSLGSPLSLTLTDPDGRRVAAATEVPLAAAARRPLAAEDVVRALGPTLGSDTLAVGGEVDVSGLDLAAGGLPYRKACGTVRLRRCARECPAAVKQCHYARQTRTHGQRYSSRAERLGMQYTSVTAASRPTARRPPYGTRHGGGRVGRGAPPPASLSREEGRCGTPTGRRVCLCMSSTQLARCVNTLAATAPRPSGSLRAAAGKGPLDVPLGRGSNSGRAQRLGAHSCSLQA